MPIHAPSEEPQQRPIRVSSLSEQLHRVVLPGPSLQLGQVAIERVDALDQLGLGSEDPSYLEKRLDELTESDRSALVHALLLAAWSTLDRLLSEVGSAEAPTALWSPSASPARIVGQTLLWADHYLVADRTLDALLATSDPERLTHLAASLAAEARLRPLLQAGVVALVPEETAHVIVADAAYEATEQDLQQRALVEWVMSQLIVEEPTEREVIFVQACDADDLGQMYFYNRIEGYEEQGDSLLVSTSALHHPYDPSHDYTAWIEQTKRQTAAHRVQGLEFGLAAAHALGGEFLATSPFEARLLARLGSDNLGIAPLVWADIPSLPHADAGTLARIAAEDETVDALRRSVRRTLAAAASGQTESIAELALSLREDAAVLQRTIATANRWKLAVPAGLGVAGIALGAVAGPIGAAGAALAAAAGLAPLRAEGLEYRRNAAYAVLLADRAKRRRQRNEPRQRSRRR
jgi:hypothetical protein